MSEINKTITLDYEEYLGIQSELELLRKNKQLKLYLYIDVNNSFLSYDENIEFHTASGFIMR